jgi:hypothetical protein
VCTVRVRVGVQHGSVAAAPNAQAQRHESLQRQIASINNFAV